MRNIKNLTNIIRGPNNLFKIFVFLDHSCYIEVTQFDFTIWKLSHQNNILRLKKKKSKKCVKIGNMYHKMIRFFRLSSLITACATNQPEKSSLHNNYSIFYSTRLRQNSAKKKKLQAHFSVGLEARILSTHSSRRHYCLIPQVLFIQNRKLTKLKVIQMVRKNLQSGMRIILIKEV